MKTFATAFVLALSTLASLRAATPDVLTWVQTVTGARFETGGAEIPGTAMLYPLGLAIGPANRIYVTETEIDTEGGTDLRDRVRVFDEDGNELFSFGGPGDGVGQFRYPMGLAVDVDGKILVADTDNNRLQLFDGTAAAIPVNIAGGVGNTLGSHGNFDPFDEEGPFFINGFYTGPPAVGPGAILTQFHSPVRIAVRPGTRFHGDPDGRIALADTANHRVIVFDASFVPLFALGGTTGPGALEAPVGVGMDLDKIYVTDFANHRVQIYSQADGTHLRSFGSAGASNAPGDLSVPFDAQPDDKGQIVVADTDHHRILILREEDTLDPAIDTPCSDVAAARALSRCLIVASDLTRYDTRVLGEAGPGPGQFAFPQAVATDALDRVVVLDTNNHRFQVFQGAKVRVESATVYPADTVPSGSKVILTVVLENPGAASLSNVTVTAVPSLGGSPLTAVIPVLSVDETSASIIFEFETDALGSLTFDIRVSGATDGGTLVVAAFTTDAVEVTEAGVAKMSILGMTASPNRVGLSGQVTVRLTVQNSGNVLLENVRPVVSVSPDALVLASTTPAAASSLARGAEIEFVLVYTAPALLASDLDVTFGAGAISDTASLSLPPSSGPTANVTIGNDAIPPVTVLSASGTSQTATLYRSTVRVTLTATDETGGSGVEAIHYRVTTQFPFEGTVNAETAPFDIPYQGPAEVFYWAEDRDGNIETIHKQTFMIDSGPPSITADSIDPAPNEAGWIKAGVTSRYPIVTFKVIDPGSGVDPQHANPTYVASGDGAAISVTGTGEDLAGNTAQATVTLKVDTIEPTLICAPTSPANSSGWFTSRGAVTVTCLSYDQRGLSGMKWLRAGCTPSSVGIGVPSRVPGVWSASCRYSREGVHTFLAEANDVAGNPSTSSFAIKIDRTPPVLSCSANASAIKWPSNHQMATWKPGVSVSDDTPGAKFKLTAYYSSAHNHHDNDDDDRDHDYDDMSGWKLNTADTSGSIRVERDRGRGRTYTLKYKATDLAGNYAYCSVSVTVPREKGSRDDRDRDERDHDGHYCDDRNHRHGDRR